MGSADGKYCINLYRSIQRCSVCLLLSLSEVPKTTPCADAPVHRLWELWHGEGSLQDRGGKHEAEVFQCSPLYGSCLRCSFAFILFCREQTPHHQSINAAEEAQLSSHTSVDQKQYLCACSVLKRLGGSEDSRTPLCMLCPWCQLVKTLDLEIL